MKGVFRLYVLLLYNIKTNRPDNFQDGSFFIWVE